MIAQLPNLTNCDCSDCALDLRVASIVIANGATLLTRNTKAFAKVPDLKHENWL